MSGLFPNLFHVARREYLVRVRGRAFVITTALLAIAVVALTLLPTILAAAGVDDMPSAVIVDQAGDLPVDPVAVVEGALAPPDSAGGDQPQVVLEDDPEAAAQAVRDGDYDALLTISRGEDEELAFEFLGSASPTNPTRQDVGTAAQQIAVADRLSREGVTPDQASEIFAPAAITAVPIDPDDARDEEDFGGAFILAYAVVILTFMAILTYGNWVAQSVAEEKSGRVMELLITAATPRQLLIGKVAGTGAAGLSQYVVIIAAAVIGYLVGGPLSNALGVAGDSPISLPDLNPTMVLTFGAFFVLGFLLYATLYAAAGSMVSRVEDAQQAAGPLIFLAIAGYFIAFTGLNDPDAQWVVVLSVVPFFSPYLMPARMLLTSPSAGEIVLALVLLVLTLALALAIASRIYSAGRASLRPARRPAKRLARDARRSMTSLAVTDGRRIELVHGDITTERLDAVANAANEALRGGGGVDGAIHRAAGPGMLEELMQRYPDGTPTGSAVATAGHDLPARWVLHAVGPVWQGGDHDEEALLDAAYRSCLRLADELGARSVGFPAISMGIYGYPAEDGARVAVRAVADHLRGETEIELVRFVLFSDETYGHFADAVAAAAES